MFIKVGHFPLLGVSGVCNYGDNTFIFTQNNLLSYMEKIDFSVIESKRKTHFWL